MAFSRTKTMEKAADALAASGAYTTGFYFPRDVRITRYYAVPEVAEAAHATQVLSVVFTNEGTDGSGNTVLATLTNDSDLADSTTRKSSAWAAWDAKEINCGARPVSAEATNVFDEIAAGSVVSCEIAKGAGTATGAVIAGIEYIDSD